MEIKKAVKKKYGELITNDKTEECCSSCCDQEDSSIPSFGVGDPLGAAELKGGEKILDIGSGPGRSCIKAAQIVGKEGKVVGLDLTEEMIAAAEENAKKAGVDNVNFVKGDAESMPFDDSTFDLVISDCVICLIPDKRKVFNETYRVLKNGGKFVISDVVSNKPFPKELKENEEMWCGCVTGAVTRDEYINLIKTAGFTSIETVNIKEGKDIDGVKTYHATFRAFK